MLVYNFVALIGRKIVIYKNNDVKAHYASDRERTGDFGEDNIIEEIEDICTSPCPVCGAENWEEKYIFKQTNKCTGCDCCTKKKYWDEKEGDE